MTQRPVHSAATRDDPGDTARRAPTRPARSPRDDGFWDPVGPAPRREPEPDWRIASVRAVGMWLFGFASLAVVFVLVPLDLGRYFGVAAGVATAFFVFGVVRGVRALRPMLDQGAPLGWKLGIAAGPVLSGIGMTLVGGYLTLLSTIGLTRGRQLRRRGRVVLPPVSEGDAWTGEPGLVGTPTVRDPAVADAWRENGRTEHASVAAFARLTLDLVALGAPPALIADAQRDAADELRHTLLCFGLARAVDGRAESPGPFPAALATDRLPSSRPLAFAQLAVHSLVDGALHEGVSARVAGRLAKRCEDPAIAAVLAEIAADEGRHAAHGWDVLTWCLAEAPEAVANALHGALATLPTRFEDGVADGARAGAWERWGLPGEALVAEEYAKARATVVRRVEALLAGARAAAA